MAHKIEIGEKETHQITLSKNWFWGSVDLRADGKKIGGKSNFVGGRKILEAEIGEEEVHQIRVVINIPMLFGWARPWPTEVWVDGELVKELNL